MNRYPGLVDSHCHFLSLKEKHLDPVVCTQEFFDAGGRWLLDVAVDEVGWDERLAVTDESRVGFSAGIHPSEAPRGLAGLASIERQLAHPRCWALGEVGLDWYRGREHEDAQRALFRAQVALARRTGKPLVIHNRLADRELLEDLDAEGWSGAGIQHCFSSDLAFARAALDRGFYLSFAGNLTYPSSQALRDVAAWAPLDRLLIETDAPYLAPQAVRGRPNRPVHAGLTAQTLANVRGLSLEDVLAVTGDNFVRLMGLTGRG